jgi:phenylalanyl-tRNA synthetase beta subunit
VNKRIDKVEVLEAYWKILALLYNIKNINKTLRDQTIKEKIDDLIETVEGKIRILSKIMI